MAKLKQSAEQMPTIPAAENARLDAEADREFAAGIGIPLDEAFAWLHDTADGVERPMPKARKL